MTRGPRRLKDDPDFKWETGCDVEDELRVVGGYDLDTSRSRLLAAVALLPAVTVGDGVPAVRPGASAWKVAVRPVVGAVTGAMLVAGAYWMGTRAGTDGAPAPVVGTAETLAEQRSPVIAAPAEPQAAPAAVPVVEPPVSRPAPAGANVILEDRKGSARLPAPAARPAPIPAEDGTAEVEPSAPTEAPAAVEASAPASGIENTSGTAEAPDEPMGAPAPRASQLGIEGEFLAPADDALDAGRFDDARKRYEQYLARFPQGSYRVEVQWGLLKSLQGSGDTAATATMAAQLQDLPAFSARREDILRLRAESLVRLDRCDDALLVAEEMSSRSAAEIRRACRQTRPE